MKCLTWNLEWASPVSKRLEMIQQMISDVDTDVVCYTEVIRTVLPDGHVIEADADYGYSNKGERRKVIIWSKTPWAKVDAIGDTEMPSGRFVSGVTGGIRFIGVCVPWKDAHVNLGREDSRPWQEHLLFCAALKGILDHYCRYDEPIKYSQGNRWKFLEFGRLVGRMGR